MPDVFPVSTPYTSSPEIAEEEDLVEIPLGLGHSRYVDRGVATVREDGTGSQSARTDYRSLELTVQTTTSTERDTLRDFVRTHRTVSFYLYDWNLNSDPSTHTGDTPSSGTNVHDGRAVTNETGRYLGRFASRPRTAQAGPFGQVQYHQFRVIEVES